MCQLIASPDRVLAVARARAQRIWLWWTLFLAFFLGSITVLIDGLHPAGKSDPRGVPVALYGLIVGVGGVFVVSLRTENRPVPIIFDGVVLRFGRLGSVPLVSAAVVGPWYQAGSGVQLGSVLHLLGDRGPIRVGGRRHRASVVGDPLYAARAVHVSVSAAEFEEMLELLGLGAAQAD